jgi:hypothetical protein
MRRLSAALALSAALLAAGGCTDPYGRVDYGRTALLGVSVGAAAALTAGALSDKPRPYYGRRGGGYGRGYDGGYGGGYGYGGPARSYGYGGGYYPSRGYYGGW